MLPAVTLIGPSLPPLRVRSLLQLAQNLPLPLDGSGSSVIIEFVGKIMTNIRDRAKLPVQVSQRPSERNAQQRIVANAHNIDVMYV